MNPTDRPKGKAGMTMQEIYARAAVRSEREIQEQIANYLRQQNIPFYRARMDKNTTGTIGWPDFTFPYRGRFYGVEVKFGGNHESPEQAKCLGMIQDSGGVGVVVRTLHEVVTLLSK
jgi:hypothetical protein